MSKETWEITRKQCDHFTKDECAFIRKSFEIGTPVNIVAKQLKCSIRTIHSWYARLKRENRDQVDPRRVPTLPRFYKSKFEAT
jgi:hypothetical protein